MLEIQCEDLRKGGSRGQRLQTVAAVLLVWVFGLLLAGTATPVAAWQRTPATIFAILPPGSSGPEGLTVGPDRNLYVASFGFTSSGAATGPGQLFVFTPRGKLIRQISIAGSSPHLLGLAFNPVNQDLIVLDFGNGNALKVDPVSGQSTVFMTAPKVAASGPGINGITFDKDGNAYISDSFQGIIWKTGPDGGTATAWVSDATLLAPPPIIGVPPFGANGVEFNRTGDKLFVANTANDTIVQIPVDHGTAGTPTVFVNSINGADGIAIDGQDNLWAAANQGDEIVVVNPAGKVIAKLGDFNGVDKNGVPHGLLFPASPAFSADGRFLYVTNLALDLRLFGLPQAIDSQWCAQVKLYTISKIPTHIPPLPQSASGR